MGLSQIPEAGKWKSPKRVSFMNNRITVLPDSMTQCSVVSTLLLQDNSIERVPEGFLLGFQALRVLNLSETRIRTILHLSLNQLSDLRALLLAEC